MCLEVKRGAKFRTLKREKITYKLVIQGESGVYSYYKEAPIKLNILTKVEGPLTKEITPYSKDHVNEGLHTFGNLRDIGHRTMNPVMLFKENGYRPVKILKAVAPVGTMYIKGTFNCKTAYVFNQLIYQEL